MNDYKNRLRNEVGRLTIALAEANMKLKTMETPGDAPEETALMQKRQNHL